jgi:hypothetical protein
MRARLSMNPPQKSAAIKGHAARALVLWTPIIAVWVLAGFAVGWWVAAVITGFSALVMVLAYVYGRRVRHRFEHDPSARQEHAARAEQRLVRWARWYGLGMAGMMMLMLVLLIIAVALARE